MLVTIRPDKRPLLIVAARRRATDYPRLTGLPMTPGPSATQKLAYAELRERRRMQYRKATGIVSDNSR
jgi:hypothetical protein